MSGHSKWSTIKRSKGAIDAKRGVVFTKLSNAIALAAKGGGDVSMNPTLALAVQKAKEANMPNANIEKAIKRGTGELGGAAIEEMLYEGYGPAGIAVVVECASDNRNRTYADVRTVFAKNGGNIAESGAVAFQFKHQGIIKVMTTKPDDDTLAALEAGALDVIEEDGELLIYTPLKELNQIRQKLIENGMNVSSAEPTYVPTTTIEIDDETKAHKVIKLMDALDELDDVTETFSNFEIADSINL